MIYAKIAMFLFAFTLFAIAIKASLSDKDSVSDSFLVVAHIWLVGAIVL